MAKWKKCQNGKNYKLTFLQKQGNTKTKNQTFFNPVLTQRPDFTPYMSKW